MKIMGVIVALLAVVVISGCETVKGVGRDITNVGSSVQQALTKH